MGTPIIALDSEGNHVWNRQLDIYGRVKREFRASSLGEDVRPFIPFLYQGQYYDFETKLAYNRFRYYSPETGAYISQDPIGLEGGYHLYNYVRNINTYNDVFGLEERVITNKFPEEELPTNGRITSFDIIDGKIKNVNGEREFDFIITKENKLVIGKKHHFLGNREDVLAAGQLKLNGQGQIRRIDNLSGHYRPTVLESSQFPDIFKKMGLNIKGATFIVWEFKINEDQLIIDDKINTCKVCH
ncbi:MAG: RHS repeat-associated core domain-containing protein [Capnocytophaga sp.]|nr:RHS repeat-associated core domain-containing protein [Capnocytophaga sp.]